MDKYFTSPLHKKEKEKEKIKWTDNEQRKMDKQLSLMPNSCPWYQCSTNKRFLQSWRWLTLRFSSIVVSMWDCLGLLFDLVNPFVALIIDLVNHIKILTYHFQYLCEVLLIIDLRQPLNSTRHICDIISIHWSEKIGLHEKW